jgi:type VI protein secretion system component Hcp
MPLDAYLDLRPQITGESTAANHEGWIELTEFTYGLGDTSSDAGDIAEELAQEKTEEGKAQILRDFKRSSQGKFRSASFSKNIDKSSPLLFKFCALSSTAQKAGATLLPKAVVHLCRFTGRDQAKNYVTYARLHFEDCNIRSVSLRVSDEGQTTEEVEMSYEKVAFIYNEISQGSKGGETRFGWEVAENKEWAGPQKK